MRARRALINSVRGTLRSQGYRLTPCPVKSFVARWGESKADQELRRVLDPLAETIAELTVRNEALERELVEEATTSTS